MFVFERIKITKTKAWCPYLYLTCVDCVAPPVEFTGSKHLLNRFYRFTGSTGLQVLNIWELPNPGS